MTRTGISRALKTVRRTVFAPRDADAGRGLFDSRMGHQTQTKTNQSFIFVNGVFGIVVAREPGN